MHGKMRNVHKIMIVKLEGEQTTREDLDINGMITLIWMLGRYVGRMWIRFIWLRIDTGVIMNCFRHLVNSLDGDQPNERPLPAHDSTTQKDVNKHPCLKRDSNSRFQCSSGDDPCLKTSDRCDRRILKTMAGQVTYEPLAGKMFSI
jgi:hypothetical protein